MKHLILAVAMTVAAGLAQADGQKVEYTSGVTVAVQKSTFEPSEKLVMENGECFKETTRLKQMHEQNIAGQIVYVPEIETSRNKVACPS
jgi:hypothetical protein